MSKPSVSTVKIIGAQLSGLKSLLEIAMADGWSADSTLCLEDTLKHLIEAQKSLYLARGPHPGWDGYMVEHLVEDE
jgi:hypothetical protein